MYYSFIYHSRYFIVVGDRPIYQASLQNQFETCYVILHEIFKFILCQVDLIE